MAATSSRPDGRRWRGWASRAPRAAVDLYWGTGVCDDVPALAWFLAAGLVPLALGLTAFASLLLGDAAQAQAVAERAARVLPADVSDQVVQLILRTRRDSTLLALASIAAMVWTSAGAVGVIERVMSRLLGRQRFGPLVGKLRHLGLATVFAALVVLMVLAAAKATGLQERLGIGAGGTQALVAVLGLAATGVVCGVLFRFSPRDGIPWSAAAVGATPAAVILTVTPQLAGVYLAAVAGRTPVRVFLVLAGVLIVCQLAAVGLLLGAAIAARRTAAAPPAGGAEARAPSAGCGAYSGWPSWTSQRAELAVHRLGADELLLGQLAGRRGAARTGTTARRPSRRASRRAPRTRRPRRGRPSRCC